jgi:D-aminopeptidase
MAGKRDAQRAAKQLIEHVRLSPLNEELIQETARRLTEIRASEQARNAVQEALKR